MNKRWVAVVTALMVSNTPILQAGDDGEKEILYWVAPMDANYRRDGPGKSPMGMDLIPVYADADEGGSDVTISPAVVQNLGVRTAPVARGTLSQEIDTVGYIDFDESKVSHVHLRVSGWIEKLAVKSAGEEVRKGQRLFNLYSPDLVNAQEEFLRALKSGRKSLITASRERLQALGVGKALIDRLEERNKVRQTIPIYASQDGVVSELPVREGMYVQPAMKVMTLADLSSVWLIAEVFERRVNAVATGDKAEASLPYLPDRVLQGEVEYIYPSLDPKTRALRVRLRFDNPDEALKPNMYAHVKIHAKPRENVLSIPLEALIRTGDKDRVIVQVGEGKFDAREVVVGIESGDRVEIVEPLQEGDRVVVSGQFLLDSEASLKASFMRMSDPDERSGDGAMDGMKMAGIRGEGTLLGVDTSSGEINIAHEPIEALDWPGMAMVFNLGDGVDLSAVEPGDAIGFGLEKRGDDYVVIDVQPLGTEQMQ